MILGALPVCVSSADADGAVSARAEWEYEPYGDGIMLTAYNGTATDVYVPGTLWIDGAEYAVLKLGDGIFQNNDSLNSVTLGAGILEIGSRAFYDCDNMVCILLAEETAVIGDEAFYSCDSFNSVILYDSVTTIGTNAFAECPRLVIWCNEGTVGHTYALEHGIPFEILNPDAEPELFEQGGITYYILNGGAHAVGYDSQTADVVIPAEVNGYPVASVKDIFHNSDALKSVVIDAPITEIEKNTFSGCRNLVSVTLPDGIKTIPESCFESCNKLETVNLPEGLTAINKEAFAYCYNLKNIKLPNSIKRIGESTFRYCKGFTEITIPNEIISLGSYAFIDCTSLKTLTLPGNISSTVYGEFARCSSLETVIISEGSTTVKHYNGFESSITNVILPSTLREIKSDAFLDCANLKNIIISEGVTNISTDSFHGSTIWYVYENSYAHTFAENNDVLYFVIRKTDNPEIRYGAQISGKVTYTDGSAAADATVEIVYEDGVSKETVKTDENGVYTFTYAEVGRYTVRVTDSADNTASVPVSVKRMNVFDVFVAGDTDLTLKKGYTVSGTVNEPNAAVTLTDRDGNVIAAVVADQNGSFAFGNIPNGEYMIKAETENGSVTTEITVFGADIAGLALIIESNTASLWGYAEVEDRTGNHYRRGWIQITVYNEHGLAVDQCKTDKDGKYSFKNLPLGSYAIKAEVCELRPDREHGFDRSHTLTGYAYITLSEPKDYAVDTIVLYEESKIKTDIIGKVTAKGSTQVSTVTLINIFGDEIDSVTTGKNGKFAFKNVPDGMYFIWAVTEHDGAGFAVAVVRNGRVYGDTKIKIEKNSSVKEHEDRFISEFKNIGDKAAAVLYKERIAQEKRYYDGLSQKEKKQLSKAYVEKINQLVQWISDCEAYSGDGVSVDGGLVVSGNELENAERVAFTLRVAKTSAPVVSADGVNNGEDFLHYSILDKAGKQEIKQYYEITMTKTTADGDKTITSVYKDTDSNGKFRITLTIPAEYRGYKNYSFVHEHCGEITTLCDLDNNPDTVTFEVDKFSRFVLTATNEEKGTDVLSGDVDLDGKLSAVDMGMLKKVLLDVDNGKSPILNDVNDDDKTDIRDLIRLKKGLSGN